VTSWAVHRPPRRPLPVVPDVLDNAQGRIRRSPCAAVVVVLRRVGDLDVVSVQQVRLEPRVHVGVERPERRVVQQNGDCRTHAEAREGARVGDGRR
jgi:hypothetical protein